jgi:glycosyltransferase 2 family protein
MVDISHSKILPRQQSAARAERKSDRAHHKSGPSPWIPRAIGVVAVALASFLLYRTLSKYSLDEIISSVSSIPLTRILLAGLFAAASYFCLTFFDFFALRYVGKPLPYRYVALASFCSLSLGHNIGFAALSSGAIRYRFYSRWGVSLGDVAKIILFCGLTVGLGLIILGGVALLLQSELVSKITGLPQAAVVTIGIACFAAAAIYVLLAAFVRGTLRFRRWSIQLPSWRLALAQIVIGPLNFALVAACLHQTLAALGEVSYLAVAAVYVIAVASALITHVPGGLGVIEAVVLYLLPHGQFIGGLLTFRALYFLLPLCIGGPLFGIAELAARKNAKANSH